MNNYGTHNGRNKPDRLHWSGTGWKKGGIWKRDRKVEKWLKWAVSFNGLAKTGPKCAKRWVMRLFKNMKTCRWIDRKTRRNTWKWRIKANAMLHGIEYDEMKIRLKEACIWLNRKSLSELGVYDRNVLSNVFQVAVPNWRERKVEYDNKGKKKMYTTEELDAIALPYLEDQYAELYTDPCIRFNRTVTDWGVEYTIDSGKDEKSWADMIAQSPELANFQVPDHWVQDSMKQEEEVPLELAFGPRDETLDVAYKQYKDQVRKVQAAREEALAEGKSPKDVGMREVPLTREDWFAPKPQSWL